ncbi:MAG: hypothetical protein IH957_06225 [Chloroflexi bacterium]|nr:hypothetical protein [Chloroflexota bacterium]
MSGLLEQHQALEHEVFDRPDRVVERDESIKYRAISLIANLAGSLDDAATPAERTVVFHAIQLWTEFLRVHYEIFDVDPPPVASATEPRDEDAVEQALESSEPAPAVASKLEAEDEVSGEDDRESSVLLPPVASTLEAEDEVSDGDDRESSVLLPPVASAPELRDEGSVEQDRESSAPAFASLARDAYIVWRASNEMGFEVAKSAIDIGRQVRQEMIDSIEASLSENLGLLRSWLREPTRIDRIGSELAGSVTRGEDRTMDAVHRVMTTLEDAIEGRGQARAASVRAAEREAGSRPEPVTLRLQGTGGDASSSPSLAD